MSSLPRQTLGRTGLAVTTLGYGAMELRGAPRGPAISDDQARDVLQAALGAGINYIDTSPDYGRSEELIGRFIADRRSEFFLASKCGCLVGAAPAPPGERNLLAHHLQHPLLGDGRSSLKESLRDLATAVAGRGQYDALERTGQPYASALAANAYVGTT